MATQQSRKVEPPKIIGAISKLAGALVGTAVVTGKRIIETTTQAGEEPSAKPEKKSVRAPAKKKKRKKAVVKTKAKGRKVKKKVAKKKSTGPRRKSKTSRNGPARSSAKKEQQAKVS